VGEVLGLKIRNGKLWACSNTDGKSMVHQFDVASGKLVKKWILEHGNEKHVFNDLALTANGDAFISDSNSDIVFHAGPHLDKPEVWVVDPRLKDGQWYRCFEMTILL